MHSLFALAAFASLAMHASASCSYGTSLHRRDAHGPVHVASYSYSGTTGPINWAGLKPEYHDCALGHNQSPIDFNRSMAFATEKPLLNIPPTFGAEIENLGSTVEVFLNGTTTYVGKTYNLVQYHFHTPGEHRINNEHYPLEMHMVHQADDGSFVVVGILFQLSEKGKTTEFVRQTIINLPAIREPGTRSFTGYLNFGVLALALQTQPIYQYSGSLTTPPCKEGITFLILANPFPMDVTSYNSLKAVMKFNWRYTQNNLNQDNLLQISAEQLSAF
ncbi:hypothetical protein D9758_010825 [Tetrapyrgos nigripes]|uniref:carbonic anhydrase n=1 Tax=Tetrapyrgos nigripes TaxID=182062 RepID=A0A8H5GI99_9AGAR|nr:hypothetical protein D9758_010825 [Tetrapyrgos nigripes]